MKSKIPVITKYFIFALAFFIFLSLKLYVYAVGSTLTVSIGVGDTILVLQGKTTPNSVVTFKEGTTVIGTTTSDALGNFSKTFSPMSAGIHNIIVYSTDIDNKPTASITVSINVLEFNTTTVNNIILPSTINISSTLLNVGETIRVHGYGVPGSDINVFFFNSTINTSTTANSTGFWEVFMNTTSLSEGQHQLYSKVTVTGGYQSEISEMLSFVVNDPTSENINGGDDDGNEDDNEDDSILKHLIDFFDRSGTNKQGGSTVPGSSQKVGLCPLPRFVVLFDYDENCHFVYDEFVDAARSFVKLWINKDEPKCDINRDNRCNLTDFSIILFYIER